MNVLMNSLWILLIAHFISDFMLQSKQCAEKKTKYLRYLWLHAFIYGCVVGVAAFVWMPVHIAWIPVVVIAASHLAIDALRIWLDKQYETPVFGFGSFVIDQVLHVGIICAMVWKFDLGIHTRAWISTWPGPVSLEEILRYLLLFVVILQPASVFVQKVTLCATGEKHTQGKREPAVGNIIGKLERIIIAILVLCGEIGAIGFVLTAKSLARYKQLNEQGFAERYLVGTLSSTAVAIIAALVLK